MNYDTNSSVDKLDELTDRRSLKYSPMETVNIENDSFFKRFRREMDYIRRTGDSIPCLHEELEKNLPPNQRGGPHMIACPCPKCNPRC